LVARSRVVNVGSAAVPSGAPGLLALQKSNCVNRCAEQCDAEDREQDRNETVDHQNAYQENGWVDCLLR
jgi:hypothetical protein